MRPRGILIDWLVDRSWDPNRLIEIAKNVAPPATSWPNPAAHPHKETLFSRLLEILDDEVEKPVTIEILEAWAKAYPGDKEGLINLAAGLRQQSSTDTDLASLAGLLTLPAASQEPAPTPGQGLPNRPPTIVPTPPGITGDKIHISQATIQHPKTVFSGKAKREGIFPQFLNFARERDLVFALGGVGSGLNTFTRQLVEHCRQTGLIVVDADLITDYVRQIERVRGAAETERTKAETLSGANVHLELKCLLTALAYATYISLRSQFPEYIERGLEGRYFPGPIPFSDYYFASAEAMYKADPVPILKHFFETVQRFAEMTKVEEVLVVMPWRKLAACFQAKAQPEDRKLGDVLWQAMSVLATTSSRRPRNPYARPAAPPPPLDMYDKVCLVACCSEVPYAHNAPQQKDLVARFIWPIPPLDSEEVKKLVEEAVPEIKADRAAAEIIKWTGGAPWFVRLLMSYVSDNRHLLGLYDDEPRQLIAACGQAAIGALEVGGNGIPEPIGGFIRRHEKKVKEALGDGHSTDSIIEEKWAGPRDEVGEGYRIQPYRLEAFVASGLTWLKGDPWDMKREDYVFAKYPTVFLCPACELSLAMYRSVTGKDVRRAAF